MNWYNLAKFGQIWSVNYRSDSVQSCLEALYKLTYQYQQMQINKFKGYPTRQENILKGIERQSRQIISDLVEILQPVFEDWLKKHAITNPEAWAEDMMKTQDSLGDISSKSIFEMISGFSYGGVDGPNDRYKVDLYSIAEQLDLPIKNKQALAFADWFYHTKVELREDNAENRSKNDTRSEDELDIYYRNMDFSEYFSTYWGDDWESFFESASQFADIREFGAEIAEFVLFPAWYEYWHQQGIDQTRENVENAYNMIKQVKGQPIRQALSTINIIINTCHQTGSMLDYICEITTDYKDDLFRAMQRLSTLADSSPEIIQWNKQLKEVGTRFPRKPIQKKVEQPIEKEQNKKGTP